MIAFHDFCFACYFHTEAPTFAPNWNWVIAFELQLLYQRKCIKWKMLSCSPATLKLDRINWQRAKRLKDNNSFRQIDFWLQPLTARTPALLAFTEFSPSFGFKCFGKDNSLENKEGPQVEAVKKVFRNFRFFL